MIDSYKLEFFQYENPSLGITVQYPSDWEIDEQSGAEGETIVKFTSPQIGTDKFQEYLNVRVSPNFHNNSTNNIRSGDESRIGFKLLEQSDASTLNGNPSHRMVCTFRNGYNEFKAMQVVTIKGDKVYRFDFYAEAAKYSNYLPIIQKMIDSFKIIDLLPSEKVNLKTYENSTAGIRMQYPHEWISSDQIKNTNKSEISFWPRSENNTRSQVSIGSFRILGETLDEIVSDDINSNRQNLTSFQLTESGSTTLASNSSAYKVIFTFTDSGVYYKEMGIYMIKGNKLFLLSYIEEPGRFSSYLPTVQKMADSLRIQIPDNNINQ
jgi:hypothetical protein